MYYYLLLLVIPAYSFSQTRLPSLFSSNMVLQQNSYVAIWGTDLPETTISLSGSWGSGASAKADSHGKWKTEIATAEAGGPFTLIIRGSEKIVIDDVLVGEVWLCSGQSNMQLPVRGNINQPVTGSNDDILKSGNPELRVFQVKHNTSLSPLYTLI